MIDFILQLILAFILASLFVSIFNRKKGKDNQVAEFQEKLAEYETITKSQILEMDDNKIQEAITYHLLDKVDNDYKSALQEFNDDEKMVYALYLLDQSCSSRIGSINDFFVNDKEMVKYVPIIFDEFGLEKANQSFHEARDLYLKYEEEYKRDIDEVVDELREVDEDEKNFFDYSKEIKAELHSEEFKVAFSKYVKEHIDSFVEKEEEEE